MRLGSLVTLVRRDLLRTRGALATSGFGIAAGTAALVFFLALGLGVRAVLLGQVFPIDQVELEPPKAEDPGLIGMLFGSTPTGMVWITELVAPSTTDTVPSPKLATYTRLVASLIANPLGCEPTPTVCTNARSLARSTETVLANRLVT